MLRRSIKEDEKACQNLGTIYGVQNDFSIYNAKINKMLYIYIYIVYVLYCI